MAKITFIEASGARKVVDALDGSSVMKAARENGVEGIEAECGGCLSCATCHGYVADEWLDRVPPASDDEKVMIECATDIQPNSRLTCQIIVTEALDGLVIEVPPTPY